MKVCSLDTLPDRRTFDRRFKVLPVRDAIHSVGQRFAIESLVGKVAAADSAIIESKGPVWHKSDRKQNRIPLELTLMPGEGSQRQGDVGVWIQIASVLHKLYWQCREIW